MWSTTQRHWHIGLAGLLALLGSTAGCATDATTTDDGRADTQSRMCEAGAEYVPGFSFVPAGAFVMGDARTSAIGAADGAAFSWPARSTTLSRSFILQRTEVTQAEWESLMGRNPSRFDACGPQCPVDSVSFFEVLRYCNRLSERDGLPTCYDLSRCSEEPDGQFLCPEDLSVSLDCLGYRLPTDAEWEYAARAGEIGSLPRGYDVPTWGTPVDAAAVAVVDAFAWYGGNTDVDYQGCIPAYDDPQRCIGPVPVGMKAANPWGISDVLGNYAEWVWDRDAWYREDYDVFADTVDPVGPAPSANPALNGRVVRGSTSTDDVWLTHLARRNGFPPEQRELNIGFRVARTVQCDPTVE